MKDRMDILYQRAEAALGQRTVPLPEQFVALSPAQAQRVLHDLQVRQVELEMQNEELLRTQDELAASRARYLDFYDLAPVGYCTVSEKGLIKEVNLTTCTLLNVPRSQLINRPISKFIFADDQDIDYLLRRTLMDTDRSLSYEVRLLQCGGTPFWGQLDVRTVADEDGGFEQRMVLSDISRRKQVEDKLLTAMAEAELANNAKSRFLAAASHDLRQPLASMSLYLDVLKKRTNEQDRDLVDRIDACCVSLSELLTDLLDVSKLDAGVVSANVCDFAVDELLNALSTSHAPEAASKGLRLQLRVRPGVIGRTDPVLLTRIVGNLVSNAIRYTDKGGVLVACRPRMGKLWLEVWDTGIGIAADKTEHVFREFTQIDTSKDRPGSGLGLAIVAKTAALLGLQTRVQSRLEQGSMFAIELPLGRSRIARPSVQYTPQTRRLRIGLVEDNRHVLAALELTLEAAGHQVIAAQTGADLMTGLGHQAPDIVISDYRLAAGETGIDVVDSIRVTFGKDLPTFIMTGDTDPALMRSMAVQGIAIHYKPMRMENLLLAIDQATERRSS